MRVSVVSLLFLLCLIASCQAWGRRRSGGRSSSGRWLRLGNRRTSRRTTNNSSESRQKRLCTNRGCCWSRLQSQCTCQSAFGSRNYLRSKRAAKIKVSKSLTNCECDGHEGGGHGSGPRPFRVLCRKASSSSSNKGNQKKKDNCQKVNNNDCTYNGNPHPCRAYNKKQEKFYEELLDEIASQQCSKLNLPGAPCPTGTFNTRKTCSEIDYSA